MKTPRLTSALLPLALLVAALTVSPARAAAADAPVNILLLTVDDMSCDSIGAFGCKLAETTPHIDRLASEGLKFEFAHVQVGNCMPSRNVLLSGRYPHNNRVEGFYQVKDPDFPHLVDLMKSAGYFTAIRGKVTHSTPYHPYGWDLVIDDVGQKPHPKDVASYYRSTKAGIAASRKAGRPFFLNVNVSDPHKPFYNTSKKGQSADDPHRPSRIFTPDEVPVPGFLFDDPAVRQELAQYYSTVRRADDCVGEVLRALEESGEAERTLLVFLSDHGMPLPFAKTALWHHSTHTPWIVRWPGKIAPGTVDKKHMISAVDFVPTMLDLVNSKHPAGIDGRSFLPLLEGKTQKGREMVVKEYNENAGGHRHPMRGVQTRRFGYIFNPWSDGVRVFKTATTGTATYRRMKELAATDANVAARLELFDHRVPEEFYDYENDPDALHNLIDDPKYQAEVDRHRKLLEKWMVRTGDHALEAFQRRDDPAEMNAYVTRVEEESAARRKTKRRGGKKQAGRDKTAARRTRQKANGAIAPEAP